MNVLASTDCQDSFIEQLKQTIAIEVPFSGLLFSKVTQRVAVGLQVLANQISIPFCASE
jgi:hypothetical protein